MRQYCRYCNNLVTGNGIYCCAKNINIAESTAKSVNRCKEFELNTMDAFFETSGYKPRKTKTAEHSGYEQIRIEEREEQV